MNRFTQALWYMSIAVMSIMSARSMYGVVEVPSFRSSFKNKLAKYQLAVVHFVNYDVLSYEQEDEQVPKKRARIDDAAKPKAHEMMDKADMEMDEDSDMMQQEMPEPSEAEYMLDMLEDMKEAFKAAADTNRYERANVGFIGVDLTKIPHLIEEFDLHDFSTLMLFKDGVPFKVKGKEVRTNALLTSRSKIKDFVDTHFDEIIADVLEDLTTQERRVPRTRVYSYPSYSYRTYPSYYGYGSPWGGYWRGGYGWRYPYWRRYGHWGHPYGGFGFGFGGRRGGFSIGFGW